MLPVKVWYCASGQTMSQHGVRMFSNPDLPETTPVPTIDSTRKQNVYEKLQRLPQVFLPFPSDLLLSHTSYFSNSAEGHVLSMISFRSCQRHYISCLILAHRTMFVEQ